MNVEHRTLNVKRPMADEGCLYGVSRNGVCRMSFANRVDERKPTNDPILVETSCYFVLKFKLGKADFKLSLYKELRYE